jgi:hypothetical protein
MDGGVTPLQSSACASEVVIASSFAWRSVFNLVIASLFCAVICLESVIASLFCAAIWLSDLYDAKHNCRLPHPLRTFVSTLCFGKKRIAQKGAHNETAQDRPRQEE